VHSGDVNDNGRVNPHRPSLTRAAALAVAIAVLMGCTTGSTTSSPPSTGPVAPRPIPAASPSPSPLPDTPVVPLPPPPTPARIYEDLSGIETTADRAHRYPIAVMLDDAPAARPQAGLSEASVVWQAPVEGGIPRYMAVYQAKDAASIGPVRSARLYFVRWAAEWEALYLHAGGPPPLKLWLRGDQDLVVNADGKRTRRVSWRAAPHNLYSTSRGLRSYARTVGAADDDLVYDPSAPGAIQQFRDGAAEAGRGPERSRISLRYTSERVAYLYDRASNIPLYDAARVVCPVLLIRGTQDGASADPEALGLFHALRNSWGKRYVILEDGTHFMELEKRRLELLTEVQSFLEE